MNNGSFGSWGTLGTHSGLTLIKDTTFVEVITMLQTWLVPGKLPWTGSSSALGTHSGLILVGSTSFLGVITMLQTWSLPIKLT